MRSLILSTAARYLLPLLMLFSLFVLVRGHNEPGGGFVGGLVAAAAFALYVIANGVEPARQVLWARPATLMGAGLALALISGLVGLAIGRPFMTALWGTAEIPAVGKPGTPLLFDVGVYLVVLGVVMKIMFSLAAEE